MNASTRTSVDASTRHEPRILVFGLGAAGTTALQALIDSGADVRGVLTRSSHVGRDAGEAVGRPAIGVPVGAVAEFDAAEAARSGANVALFFTTSSLTDLLDAPLACLEAGINVITIGEDALHPWPFDEATARTLDEAATRGGATLIGTGVNDGPMVRMPVELAGFVSGVTRIELIGTGDFAQFGAELLQFMQIGVEPGEWVAPEAEPGHASITRQCAHAIAALAGLEVTGEYESVEPTLARTAIEVSALELTLQPGLVSGSLETTRLESTQGVEVEVRLFGACFDADDEEYAEATVHSTRLAHPITMRFSPMPGIETTIGVALSRIPDVLAAAPGYARVDEVPAVRFRA